MPGVNFRWCVCRAAMCAVLIPIGATFTDAQTVKGKSKPGQRRLVTVPLQREFARAKNQKLKTPFLQPSTLTKLNGHDFYELCLTTVSAQ
jgi:hypothetical protein